MRTTIHCKLVLIAALSLASTAYAQEEPTPAPQPTPEATPTGPGRGLQNMEMDDEQARRHFAAGRSLYEAGRFALAAEEFSEAYRLSQRPQLLYNMYLAYRDANGVEHAADALRRYLEGMRELPDRPQLEARLAALEETVRQRHASEERQEALAHEAQRLRAQRERELQEREAARRAREAEGPYLLPWFVVGAGGVLLVAGSVVGAISLSNITEVEEGCFDNDACPSSFDLEGERDQAKSLALITDVLFVAGVAAVGTGIVLAITHDDEDPDDIAVSGACTPTGCGASVRGSF